ncbi:MAG: hypothetical protein NTY36_00050 [Deltaproteobacteria bacterium]|nr:hypothetical protein [Deltaproteobacteria bacterium]
MESFRDIGPFKLLEKERRQIAGMFAHDLKTPVVAVAGLLNRLRQGKVGELNEPQKAYLETIYQEIARLEKLINNFLDYVRLDLHIITPLPQLLLCPALSRWKRSAKKFWPGSNPWQRPKG